jgi:hypothetical protein
LLNRPITRWLTIALACFLALMPFFWRGIPSGHDFEFHLFSWMEVVSQWHQGIFYPRWAALAHWGYGEARFLFYPPASWMLGAALGTVLPWKLVTGAFIWITLCLAGLSMHRLVKELLSPRDALFAAVFYAVNPYHIVIAYWRSAFAELMAAALLPLLLLALLRLKEPGLRPALRLSLILAAAWLTNAPAAVMIHYSAAGLSVLQALVERSWYPLRKTAIAVALGLGLASFYVIPAAYEERWVNIAEVLSPGLRPQENFLFTNTADPEHNAFNLFVSTVAAAEIAVVAVAIWFSRRGRFSNRAIWVLVSAWGALAALVMLSPTKLLWQYLPEFRFMQLPWRWLLCLNAALAILVAAAARRWSSRIAAYFLLMAVVVWGAYRIQQPWWDSASDVAEMRDDVADGTGYEGTDEYVPLGADPYELNKDLPQALGEYPQSTRIEVPQWDATAKHLIVHADSPELLTLRLFNYPAWEVTLDGKPLRTETTDVTGQMQIPLHSGANDIRIHFGRTRDRTIGGWISLASLVILTGAWIKTRPSPLLPPAAK